MNNKNDYTEISDGAVWFIIIMVILHIRLLRNTELLGAYFMIVTMPAFIIIFLSIHFFEEKLSVAFSVEVIGSIASILIGYFVRNIEFNFITCPLYMLLYAGIGYMLKTQNE